MFVVSNVNAQISENSKIMFLFIPKLPFISLQSPCFPYPKLPTKPGGYEPCLHGLIKRAENKDVASPIPRMQLSFSALNLAMCHDTFLLFARRYFLLQACLSVTTKTSLQVTSCNGNLCHGKY